MSYQVLARKWRPQKFSEVAGQEHIVRTLQNALDKQRVAHAYLFVGPRGTGKTTTARILAKALNCETGIVPEPCCQCPSCLQVAAGNSLDIVEIDGASHNSVDDVRELRENAQYTPRGRYKIYIIDEVHMLSNAAWNALLKTLEEPPPHIKFFFATTEPHKVLATILSRCQRFDLKRLPAGLIAERLRWIADAESVRIEDRAIAAIARAADGGMRDGQSIFDQVISFCGGDDGQAITEEQVISVFGLASGNELKGLVQAILENDSAGLINLVQQLADRGRDLERTYGDLLVFVRNLAVTGVCRDPEQMLDASETEIADLQELAGVCEAWRSQTILEKLADCESWLRNALNKRVYLEVVLIKVMHHAHSVPIDQVIERLNQLRDNTASSTRITEEKSENRNDKLNPPSTRSGAINAKTESASSTTTSSGDDTSRSAQTQSRHDQQAAPPDDSREPISTTPFDTPPPSAANREHIEPTKAPTEVDRHYEKSEAPAREIKENPPAPAMAATADASASSQARREKITHPENGEQQSNNLETKGKTDKDKRIPLSSPEIRKKMENDPFVRKVADIFEGKIVESRG